MIITLQFNGVSVSDVCMYMTGYEATDTVHIVNGENEPMQFTFVESSCHAAGYTVNLVVEPMHGTVPAKSRFVCCVCAAVHYFGREVEVSKKSHQK